MKKITMTLIMIMGITTQMFAMSLSNVRNHARFISDRMAYELDLTPMQYDDCYEINYDFIYYASQIMDDVAYGYGDAIDYYYRLLDNRNEDMRYVLSNRQYTRFLTLDYFYRPIYTTGRNWAFRIYTIYSNNKFFYYDAPSGYKTYKNGHSANNYYNNRYQHETYKGNVRITGSTNYNNHNRNDFGTVRRDRNDKEKNSINNYRNPNQTNRTQDSRYQDNSGNKQSPQINNRPQGEQRTSGMVRGEVKNDNNRNNSNAGTRTNSNTNTGSRGGRR